MSHWGVKTVYNSEIKIDKEQSIPHNTPSKYKSITL